MHWVGWQKVTWPKSEGGLGLHNAKGRNLSLLAKLNWRFHSEKDSLWSKVLRSKYCNRQRLDARNPAKLPYSRLWSAMKKGEDIFRKGTRWIVGRNSELSFWFDNWCSDGPLKSLVQGPLSLEEERLKVKEVVTVNGWNWSKISFSMPDRVSTKLKATLVSLAARGQDRLAWGMSSHGGFELKSAYKIAIGSEEGDSSFTGQRVWKTNILPFIQTFVWMCLHNSIGVKECLTKRGVQVDPSCPLCLSQTESIFHALRDCRIVKNFWAQLEAKEVNTSFFCGNLQQWVTTNGRTERKKHKDHPPWRT